MESASMVHSPHNIPTLEDLMVMLSELHPTALGHNDLRTIKQLRLVNKVLRRLASTAVQRLSVTVGGKIPPAAVEGAQLKDLNVTVEVETGGCI